MARLVRIGIFSFAKFQAAFMGVIGLILGLFFFLLSGTDFAIMQPNPALFASIPMPVVMLVLIPLIYALAGFIVGLAFAFFFNIGSSAAGGIQFEMEKGFKEN